MQSDHFLLGWSIRKLPINIWSYVMRSININICWLHCLESTVALHTAEVSELGCYHNFGKALQICSLNVVVWGIAIKKYDNSEIYENFAALVPYFAFRESCNNSILLALTLEQEVYFSVRPWTYFLNQQGHIGISRFGEYCWETGIYGARMNSVRQPAAGVCCSSLLATTSTLGYHREFTFDICQVRRQAGEGSSEQAAGEEKGERSTGPARIVSSWYLPNSLSLSPHAPSLSKSSLFNSFSRLQTTVKHS
jgi:hypothetical protein